MRDFSGINRLVIKIGSNVLSDPGSNPGTAPGANPGPGHSPPHPTRPSSNTKTRIETLASDIADLHTRGHSCIIVTSGAIAFGTQVLGMPSRPTRIALRQACAAAGQPVLMDHWRRALKTRGLVAAQILLRRENFDDRRSFLNLRNTIESLLELNAVPIINENDSVSTSEIDEVFGDNDSLSAHVASKLDARLLVLLTDIDALYNKDPRTHSDATPLTLVEKIDPAIRNAAGNAGSHHATGGMKTKLDAVEIASRAGCQTILADGTQPHTLQNILSGHPTGTLFLAGKRIGARSRWILGARPRGTILIDPGAARALHSGKSLLPSGITGIHGAFSRGDIVRLEPGFHAISALDSDQLRTVMGHHSSELPALLGTSKHSVAARAEDIVPEQPEQSGHNE